MYREFGPTYTRAYILRNYRETFGIPSPLSAVFIVSGGFSRFEIRISSLRGIPEILVVLANILPTIIRIQIIRKYFIYRVQIYIYTLRAYILYVFISLSMVTFRAYLNNGNGRIQYKYVGGRGTLIRWRNGKIIRGTKKVTNSSLVL